jgi:aminopeptidase N
MNRALFGFLAAVFLLSSGCGIFGIHFKLHNPRRAGKYPKADEARLLLGSLTRYRTCYDVKYYGLNVEVDPKRKYLKGYVEIMSLAMEDFDTLQLDLHANMQLNGILEGEKELGFIRKKGAVFVAMGRKVKAGDVFSLRVAYEGKPAVAPKPPWKGGFVWKKDKQKNPWIGVACETEGASLWWPNKDHTSDESDSTAINITIPEGLVAVGNGRLRETYTIKGMTTFKWFVANPVNNYDITLYTGNFKLLQDTFQSRLTGQVLDINHYVLAPNYELAKNHFPQVKQHLAFYEMRFGPYPWYKDGFKLVESPYAGMEHQSGIAYGNGYKNGPYGFDYIILHETAHEWWGNSVSAADLADGWLHEGFATYSEVLYVEHAIGIPHSYSYLSQYRYFIKNKRPLVAPKGIRYFNYKDGDIYVKGAWVLHTLRNTIHNDSLFFQILRSFAVENRARQISSEEFISHVNRMTNADYSWFFKQYLFTRKVPVLEFVISKDGMYTYRWMETADDFKMPATVTINGQRHNLNPTASLQTMTIKAGKEDEVTFNDWSLLYKVER